LFARLKQKGKGANNEKGGGSTADGPDWQNSVLLDLNIGPLDEGELGGGSRRGGLALGDTDTIYSRISLLDKVQKCRAGGGKNQGTASKVKDSMSGVWKLIQENAKEGLGEGLKRIVREPAKTIVTSFQCESGRRWSKKRGKKVRSKERRRIELSRDW